MRVSDGSSYRQSTVAVYIARAEYSLIPDDAVDQRKLGFYILLFKQQFKASLEQFYIFKNFAADSGIPIPMHGANIC